METVGERIKRLRDEKGLSRADLAYKVGISPQGMAALENGESKLPTFPVGLKLAAALDASPWELAGEREPKGIPSPGIVQDGGIAAEDPIADLYRLRGEPTTLEDLARDVLVLRRLQDLAPNRPEFDALVARFDGLQVDLAATNLELGRAQDRIEALEAAQRERERSPRPAESE